MRQTIATLLLESALPMKEVIKCLIKETSKSFAYFIVLPNLKSENCAFGAFRESIGVAVDTG